MAIDAIRSRFGVEAVVPATLVDSAGIRVKRRGDQQWGPSEYAVGMIASTNPAADP